MPTLPTDATFTALNQPYVYEGWYPNGFVDQFIRKIRFERLQKPTATVLFNRVSGSLPGVDAFAPEAPMDNTAINASQQTVTLKRLGDVVLLDHLSGLVAGNVNDPMEMLTSMRKVSVIRTLGFQIINGDGTGANLAGLNALLSSGTQYTAVDPITDLPTWMDLRTLVHTVRASDGFVGGGADCLVTTDQVIRYFLKLQDTANDANRITFEYDADLGVPVPHFMGIPIYIGQVNAVDQDIWALKLNGPTGVRVIHATGSPEGYGVEVTPVPMQSTPANRGAFVGGMYGLMVPEAHSIARLGGILGSALSTAGAPALTSL